MRTTARHLTPLLAAVGAALAVATAPAAIGEPDITTGPDCTDTGGSGSLGSTTTECTSPGNVQIDATPGEPAYPYPWGDELYGPGLLFGAL